MTTPTDPAPDPLNVELDALPTLDLDALRLRWRRLTRRPAPPGLRRDLLAHEMQTRAYGGLPRETARLLDRLAADADPAKALAARRPARGTGRPSPGTQLVREHAGRIHRVTVTAAGYLWNGTTYASLSPIAEAITGTRWNGPRFFGLRERGGSEDGSGNGGASRRARPEARP